MKKSIFSYSANASADEVNLTKIGTLEARNLLLTEQVQNLEKNITVLNQTIVHLTTHQQQKEEDAKKYSLSILKKDKQMREFLKRLERVGKLVYVLQQYQVVSLITDDDVKQLYETTQRLNNNTVDFANTFDEDFDFSVKILNMLQLAFSDLVEKLYQREDALNYLISELSLGKQGQNNDALNTSFEGNLPIASSSMLQEESSEDPINELSDSFVVKANQFLKDIRVHSKEEWKDIKQEITLVTAPNFITEIGTELINEKLSSITENYQKLEENLQDKDLEIILLKNEVDLHKERAAILMKQLTVTAPRVSPPKQIPRKVSPQKKVQDSHNQRRQPHIPAAPFPSLNSPTLNSTQLRGGLYSPSVTSDIMSRSELSSIRGSREVPKRPTGLEGQDIVQNSASTLPLPREPSSNPPLLNERLEESTDRTPLQSSNLSRSVSDFTHSRMQPKRNIFDTVEEESEDDIPLPSSSPSSLSRARQPPPTKVSPTFHPRSPKDTATRELRSSSLSTSIATSLGFSSALSNPTPVVQPALPERQNAIPKPNNKPQRKEMATTKSMHSSPEYARHQPQRPNSRSNSPVKSRHGSPTRSYKEIGNRSEEPAVITSGYDRKRAVETLRKKALEVESLIQQMQN